MGQSYGKAGAVDIQHLMKTYGRMLPDLSQIASGTGSNTALDQLKAANTSMNPNATGAPLGLNELNLQQMEALNPRFSAAGAQTATDLGSLNRQLNPEYYQAAKAASDGAARGVNAIDLTGLSPGESNAVERSLNQTKTATGNAGLVNPTNVISDAMNFGGAYNSKIGLLNNATNTASTAANATAGNGGFNPTGAATQFGQGQFVNASAPVVGATPSTNALNFASGLMSNMTGGNSSSTMAGASMFNNTSPTSYINSSAGAIGSL